MKKIFLITGMMMLIGASAVFAAGIPQEKVTRPEGSTPFQGDRAELVAKGELLWNDKSLGKKGKKACSSCHKGNTKSFKKTFLDEYPHKVKMPSKKAKLDEVGAEQMVQFCFLAAMGMKEVLPWDSEELAALTAYTVDVVQKDYIAYKASK